MKKIWRLAAILSLVLILPLASCKAKDIQPQESNLTLQDIAYRNLGRYDNTIYVLEDKRYIPYLVFSSDYDENVLLLRRDLTDETARKIRAVQQEGSRKVERELHV